MLGITISPSYVGEPECNGVIERFMRTLKEQCLYLHRFQTLYNHEWLIERLDDPGAGSSRGMEGRGVRIRPVDLDRGAVEAPGSILGRGAAVWVFPERDILRTHECAKNRVRYRRTVRPCTPWESPGGGNFLAALGLLCYGEFGGKFRFGVKRADGRDVASKNFNQFFDILGSAYLEFRRHHNVYDLSAAGLAREYYAKKSCTIAMVEVTPGAGLRVDGSGHYSVIVESYSRDLKKADAALLEQIRAIHTHSHGTYGAPRIQAELAAAGRPSAASAWRASCRRARSASAGRPS